MISTGALNLSQLDRAYTVVIQHALQPLGVLHQVTLRPEKVKGSVIRLGETQGDELNGWQHAGNITVIAVLGEAVEVNGAWECRPIAEISYALLESFEKRYPSQPYITDVA